MELEEWHIERAKGIGASDAPALAGVDPWKTAHDVWLDKLGLKEKVKPNWAMQRGIDTEPVARDIYETSFGLQMPPKNFVHKDYDFIRANLDGYNEETNTLIEIKVPGKKTVEMAMHGLVPCNYFCQIQYQLMVSNAVHADYVVYDSNARPIDQLIYVVRLLPNQMYQRKLMRLAKWFWHQVQNKKPIKEHYKVKLKTPKY